VKNTSYNGHKRLPVYLLFRLSYYPFKIFPCLNEEKFVNIGKREYLVVLLPLTVAGVTTVIVVYVKTDRKTYKAQFLILSL